MRTFRNLIKYHFLLYVKTNKIVMPLLAWISYMYVSYSVMPVDYVPSVMISIGTLFYIMLWIGITYHDSIDPVSEQIILLKVKKSSQYYISKNSFLFFLGVIMSIIGAGFPIIHNAINGYHLFTRNINIWDMFCSLVLHVLVATMAIAITILFQPRCMKNRKNALVLLAVVSIVAIVKIGLIKSFPLIKSIMWLFPPLSEILLLFSGKEWFYVKDILGALAYGIVYSSIIIFIGQRIVKKKLF